jgi:hypothetical protein
MFEQVQSILEAVRVLDSSALTTMEAPALPATPVGRKQLVDSIRGK